MEKVTALGLDVITEASGHIATPVTPSVCVTPAAPAAMPIPYPAGGTSREGIAGGTARTKINGAPAATAGSAFAASHGNEPGTLKEIASHNTGGPAPVLFGAPTVLIEHGMAGITGSPLMINRSPGPTTRTAPAVMGGAGMAFGTAALGGGASSGGSEGEAAGKGGDESGDGDGDGTGDAPPGQDGQCSGSDPVDVITGRVHTLPAVDLELPGPLPLVLARVYSSAAAARDVGLGFGWVCSWSWEIEIRRRAIVVWSDAGIATEFPRLDIGAEQIGPWGWALRRERERLVLDQGDGIARVFAAVDDEAERWKLIEIRDRNDNRIELTYDEQGRLSEVTDSAGRVIGVESTRAGRIAAIHVRNARAQGRWIAVASYSYDAQGNLAAATDAEGHTVRYAYDDEHRLTRSIDRAGLAFSYVYDREGRCVEAWGEFPGQRDPSLADGVPEVLADGVTKARGIHHIRIGFHANRYRQVADSTQVRRYHGNRHGLVSKRSEGFGTETAAFDARGLKIAEVDGAGGQTTYVRDARGRVTAVTDPLGRTTRYERDERGDVVRVIDPAGGGYELHRDARGNVIDEVDPTDAVTTFAYDARGLVTAVTSPRGAATRFTYDAEGNLVEETTSAGARWRWAYDTLGRRVQEIDPLGREARASWTPRGDLAALHRHDGSVIRYVYDGERQVTEIQGPGRRNVALAWGGFRRLAARTDPAGSIARFRYNREGELIEVENEIGELYRLHRNAAGLVTREETFDGRRLAYKRDVMGRVVRAEVAGEVTALQYNAAGEIVRRTLGDETTETFTYDARGEIVAAAWPGGEVRFERDAAGRVLCETQVVGAEAHAVGSLYDKAGERVRRFTSRGHVEQIERDATGARTRTILDELHDVHHARDALGREVMRALPRGGRIHQAYDPLGRVLRRWATASGSLRPLRFHDPDWASAGAAVQPDRVTVDRRYKYDAEGERSDELDRRRGWLQFEYDATGRLAWRVREATGVREGFAYDRAGNPHPLGIPCEYGPGGRLLRRGPLTYAWDAAGRLREKRDGDRVWRFSWDGAGRLAGVALPDGRRVAYAYDPLGRRVESQTLSVPSAVGRSAVLDRTRFVWDGDVLAHAIRTRAAEDGDPVVEERTFCFEDGSFVPWAQRDAGPDGFGGEGRAWRYFVNDPIGTPDELVGGDGMVVAELDRAAWGRTRAVEGSRPGTPLRFQGQYEDEETGLHYNRFRYYEPEAGVYVSPDPIGLAGGLRGYGYGINPTGWIDPLGLAPTPLNKGGFMVYGLHTPGGTTPYYVGMTNNERRRQCEHEREGRMASGSDMRVLPGSESLTYAEARGHEQALMEHYGTKTGWPGNVRNSIDPKRKDPRGQVMHQEHSKKKGGL